MASAARLLAPRSSLARTLPGFTPRPQQVALAEAIETALAQGRPCLAEAGTGVGKTLAYLVPLVQWLEKTGGRAVVSTHTIALQSQLIERDIPLLLTALKSPIEAAVLKGRQNFLCLQELEVAAGELWTGGDPLFATLQRWSNETDTGDVAELDFTYPAWSDVAANADTCRQRDCRHYDRCFYYKARKAAEGCRLLVVNHALFFADLRLRQANPNGPSLLPDYQAVVFDEAHHVDEIATRLFGVEWSSGRVPRLLSRCRKIADLNAPLLAAIDALHSRLLAPILGGSAGEAFLGESLAQPPVRAEFFTNRDNLIGGLDQLARELTALADRANAPTDRDRAAGLARITTRIAVELQQVAPIDLGEDEEAFHWFQLRRGRGGQPNATLTRTPHEVVVPLTETLLARTPRVTLVSATLASLGTFDYLKERLGLGEGSVAPAPVEAVQGSPFDFERNCLLYVPRRLGPPNASDDYAESTLDEIEALATLAGGRTFALFTSHRMVQRARERFEGKLPFPLFVQGDQPAPRLVDAFVRSGNGVLLGTSSFWEGVDVPGEALSLVVMDKLPFATPDSPPQKAREQRIQARGGDPFSEFSLPRAGLRLKQGFGRLLRTVTDRGVVAILDARLWTKAYGRQLLEDLPPCPRTDDRDTVKDFFNTPPPQPVSKKIRSPRKKKRGAEGIAPDPAE